MLAAKEIRNKVKKHPTEGKIFGNRISNKGVNIQNT